MDKHTEQKRDEILQQMRQIERLRQGTLSEQYYAMGEKRQGPYYVLQGYQAGKHWSTRVAKDQVDRVRADLEGHARFEELRRAFVEVTQTATIAQERAGSKKKDGRPARPGIRRPKRS